MHTVTHEQLTNRVLMARKGLVLPKGGKHILLACMPKSGSTFLSKALAQIPGMEDVTLTFGYERREQELCLIACSLAHGLNYVAQHHVRYSRATQNILTSFDIFPVILTRNIYDCVVSLRDHLERESTEIPIAYMPAHILELPKEKQYDLIIDFAVPWYANFFACWSEYTGPCIRLMYREMVEDFPGTIARILRAVDMETSEGIISNALANASQMDVRFNVGRTGRGMEELSARQIARIREMFANYSAFGGVDDLLYLKSA